MKIKPKLLGMATLVSATLVLSFLMCLSNIPVEGQGVGAATIEIVNPLTSGNKFIFDAAEHPINSTFTVDFYIENVTGMRSWQILISWNDTVIHYQKAWIPDDSVFAAAVKGGAVIVAGGPSLEIDGDQGYIKYGATVLEKIYVDVPGVGLLCRINFTVAAEPELNSQIYTNIELIPRIPFSTSLDTFVILKASPVPVMVIVEPAIVRIHHHEPAIVQDLAVASLTSEPSTVEVGDVAKVEIVLENLGNDLEVADVTVKYNETLLAQFTQTLGAYYSLTREFEWNTTDVSPGEYTISVDIQPLPYETNTTNNHAETKIIVNAKLAGLNYVGWLILLWLNTPLGILAVVTVSAFIGFVVILRLFGIKLKSAKPGYLEN